MFAYLVYVPSHQKYKTDFSTNDLRNLLASLLFIFQFLCWMMGKGTKWKSACQNGKNTYTHIHTHTIQPPNDWCECFWSACCDLPQYFGDVCWAFATVNLKSVHNSLNMIFQCYCSNNSSDIRIRIARNIINDNGWPKIDDRC